MPCKGNGGALGIPGEGIIVEIPCKYGVCEIPRPNGRGGNGGSGGNGGNGGTDDIPTPNTLVEVEVTAVDEDATSPDEVEVAATSVPCITTSM